jgi:hypothetical protein
MAVFLAVSACKGTIGQEPPDADTSVDGGALDSGTAGGGWDAGPLTNVIDQIVVPMLLENGLPVTSEDPGVLCRRLSVDLSGITPTPSEITGICTQSASQIADYYMNKTTGINSPAGPPYVWVNRRWWADLFEYKAGTGDSGFMHSFYAYVTDLDALVGQLYAGTIMYDEFTRMALASPAFARQFGIFDTNQDLIQIASQAYLVFMGRVALPSEAQDFGNLWTPWVLQYWTNAPTIAAYPSCADINAGAGCYHSEIAINAAACQGINELSCTSTVMGPGVVDPPGAMTAFDGGWSTAMETSLEVPGSLMAAQSQWAEAAVDRELIKYLGWWEAGFYVPNFEIPAVRTALAQYFASTGYSMRALDKEIVTSVLFTQKAALANNELPSDPIWAFGPTKMMYAEAWLDSLGQALGKQLGGCDFRYPAFYYANQIPGYVNFPVTPGLKFNYAEEASLIGGCPVASAHGTPTGILPAATRRAILVQLCPGSFPAGGQTLTQIAQTEFAAVGRAGTPDEISGIVTELTTPVDGSCDPNHLSACPMQQMADGLCNGLFASAAFTFY